MLKSSNENYAGSRNANETAAADCKTRVVASVSGVIFVPGFAFKDSGQWTVDRKLEVVT
jgi:hypothetical protein